jgi:hypothetical protein
MTAEEVVANIRSVAQAGSTGDLAGLAARLEYVRANLAVFSPYAPDLINPLTQLLELRATSSELRNTDEKALIVNLQSAIVNILARANRPESRADILHAWYERRNPHLANLIRRKGWQPENSSDRLKIYFALKFNQVALIRPSNHEHLRLLVEAADDDDREIARRAQTLLLQLEDEKSLEALAELWGRTRSPRLLDILAKKSYFSSSAGDLQIPIALRTGQLEIIEMQGRQVALMLERAAGEKSRLAESITETLANLESERAQQILCKWIIERDMPLAQEAAVEAGYAPHNLTDRVLFYFLTEQWQEYDKLDFDRRMLRALYQNASVALRNRLAALIRKSGRLEFLEIMPAIKADLRTVANTLYEAQVQVSVLASNGQWDDLWRQVFELPPVWSVFAMRTLVKSNWQPQNREERALFGQLRALVRRELVTNPDQLWQVSFFKLPLAQAKTEHLQEVQGLLRRGYRMENIIRVTLQYLELVLLYRFRHAIEIDMLPQLDIAPGDIEIEVVEDNATG